MRVVVPYGAADPKTRLSPVLDAGERRALAAAMCRDVCEAVQASGGDPEVLATATGRVPVDAPVRRDERSLTAAVNAVLAATEDDVAVVMADLALATPDALGRLFDADGEVVLAPGLGGGTNALVCRHPAFRVDYHGASVRDHRAAAREVGARLRELDSFRLATDVDDPSDLAEVLLHGDGEAREWVADRFDLAVDGGRVGVARTGN
ncbi:MAG: 2-phospho-L-lactate guanylyltransferase [Halobacteriaceae archaeon]